MPDIIPYFCTLLNLACKQDLWSDLESDSQGCQVPTYSESVWALLDQDNESREELLMHTTKLEKF